MNIVIHLKKLYGRIFGGIPKILVLCNFLRKFMVSDKRFTALKLELVQLYKQHLHVLEKFFIFTIYQNYMYTLALKGRISSGLEGASAMKYKCNLAI